MELLHTPNSTIFCNAVSLLGYSSDVGVYYHRGERITYEFIDFGIQKDGFNFQLPNVIINNNRNELMDSRWEQLFSAAILNEDLAKEPDETNLDFAKRFLDEIRGEE